MESELAAKAFTGGKMATRNSDYQWIVAELVMGHDSKGSPKRQVRPTRGEKFSTSLNIECSKKLRELPIGTKFRIQVMLTDMEGAPYLYSHHSWPVEFLPRK